ncbi:DNA internalization-related competence protein ComEC/Rec2 [bacterium]|nr:DNA internalization-related competence protein ComEC/Rec2 [candidate division CSSED10-310 bacterium]
MSVTANRSDHGSLFIPAISVITGMIASNRIMETQSVAIYAWLSVCAALLTIGLSKSHYPRIAMIFSFLALGIASMLWHHVQIHMLPKDHVAAFPPVGEVAVVGEIASFPVTTRTGGRVDVDVAGVETQKGYLEQRSGRIRLNFSQDAWYVLRADGKFLPGMGIRCETNLARPEGFRNPGCFDPEAHFRNNRIYLTGSVRDPEFITLFETKNSLMTMLGRLRITAVDALDEITLGSERDRSNNSTDKSAISKALLLGTRDEISPETQTIFQEAGLVHLLAISGLHVGVIAGIVSWLLKRCPCGIRTRNIVLMLIIGVYAVFTGGNPSVVRAACLVLCHMTAGIFHRPSSMVNTLSISIIVLLFLKPGWINDPGFQLTFAATFGIALLYPGLKQCLKCLPGRWVGESIAVALAAQCATTPVSAMWFNRISILGAIVGLPMIPLTSLVLICGLAALLFHPIPLLGAILMNLHATLLGFLMRGAAQVSSLPWITIPIMTPAPGVTVTTLIGIGLLSWKDHRGLRSILACLLVPLFLFIIPGFHSNELGKMDIWMLDVGNGDCILIRFPDGHLCMIDAGGILDSEYDIGSKIVVRTVRTLGIDKINTVVITHAHPDHQLGMKSVMKTFRPSELWVLDSMHDQVDFQNLLTIADDNGIKVRTLESRQIYQNFPFNENNRSVVLGIRYGRFRVMLPGDAEKELESGVLSYGSSLKSPVLKVGHHGSGSSSSPAFIRAVSPLIAMIPCGRHNRFDHPHASALRNIRLSSPGVHILRSDLHGMIHVQTDGRELVTQWLTDEPAQ